MTVLDEPAATPIDDESADAWVDVCAFDALVRDRGVAALVGGDAVAVFRCSPDDAVYAIADIDPFSGASVLSRGIVGSAGDRTTVASPIHRQRFDLATGAAIDTSLVRVATWVARVRGGRVQVACDPRLPSAG